MKIAIEAQRIFRTNKHGMDFVALETIRELQKIDHDNEYYVLVAPGDDHCLEESNNFHIVKILADNAVQTSGKILFNIINRNNNRYFRLFFHDYSPCLIAKLPVQAISWQEKSQLFQGRFIQISDSI